MKLLRAEFKNFRLLRDLELRFSTDDDKNLTVIRAANESGKTTILHALQWALYGDSALPGEGKDFRLHPIDWDEESGKRVPISATVEFELTTYRKGATGGPKETRRRYRIVRTAFEDIDATTQRAPAAVRLYALNETGTSPIDAPESFINDELPPELREVFFTDGDRALSFIEADVAVTTKRARVQRAIRSLLGLGVIEDAIKHVRQTAAAVNKQAKQDSSNSDLTRVASRLDVIEDETVKLEAALADAQQQYIAFDEKIEEKDRQIEAALQKGDKEKLAKDLDLAKRKIKQLDDQLLAANKEHSALFRSRALGIDILAPVLAQAFAKLQVLKDQRKIPNSTLPVLEDRLASEVCICGESLADTDADGHRRREHIQHLIEESRKADEFQGTLTTLYFEGKSLQPAEGARAQWLEDYEKVVKSRDGLQTMRDEAGREMRALELQLDAVPDTDVQGLKEARRRYKEQKDRFLARRTEVETQLSGLKREREQLTQERERLLKEQKKGARILSQLEVAQDVMQVLQNSFDRITKDELRKVSELMNKIFLEMIGADPEHRSLIQKAVISPEFDIIVYGLNNQMLNPDRDLNGASRRALTLAFILALTKVSEVEAPNVIDTPLGMTSGFVKRSILKKAVEESSQLVLFLTHDEIAGCEDIIDQYAGVVFTLTNPAHYPTMIVHDPGTRERKVLRCGCNHRTICPQCERRLDAQIELRMVS
jgi:DNA sulfur modification protein DndD